MFTGIIQGVGRISSAQEYNGDQRFRIECPSLDFSDMREGDSLAVNGACLTMLEIDTHAFSADVSAETLQVTTLRDFAVGTAVNLEPALTLNGGLHGHLVSGHVDAVAKVLSMSEDARSLRVEFTLPETLSALVAPKGSIAIDGVSLTINQVNQDRFGVNIIPHTMEQTIFGHYQIDTLVNLEADMMARYAARYFQVTQAHD